jgi:hypothetical protein
MSKIVRVGESNYRLKVKNQGTITLDTGYNPVTSGVIPQPANTVVITGDLLVLGESISLQTTNLEVEDNLILLNRGETGLNGVTEGSSGIQIQRSFNSQSETNLDVQLVWIESIDKFVLQYTNGNLIGVRADSYASSPSGNLQLDMQAGGGTIQVINSTDYETRVVDNNDIPNRKFVTDYVLAFDGYAVVDRIFSPIGVAPGNEDTLIVANPASLNFLIKPTGGTLSQRAQITQNGLDVDAVRIYQNTIQNTSISNLILTSAITKTVEINSILNFIDTVVAPLPTGGETKLYAQNTNDAYTPGDSGIYFTNNISTDELVAKNRALLFSILF